MRFLSAVALTFAFTLAAQAQLPPDKALATMQAAPGFQVELFAAEPMLMNPTSIDIDHKGRVWVAEAVNYRRVGFNRPIIRKEGDRIVVLIDTDGDGKADESKVFYQGKDLYGPLSVCVIPQADGKALRVLVAQSPDILEFWDKDGDLKADGPPTKFLTGFGGFDHDHGVHGLNIGPDGKLYFTVGDSGVTGLQSKDKKGPVFKSNTTTIQKGTVWRCDLDGNNVELIAHNFRNNYECCVDSFGEIWLSDNDDDGNQQTRICFVMPGGNYGYGPRGPGESHWHEEQPGIVHKVLRTGFGSPTGITFYEGNLLPEKYRGALLHTDAGPREVRAFFRKPKGAGYELDKEVLLTSTETWFRPSDVCVAPDGSIFVADWYDKNVGGHGMNDPQDGRIYRLTPKGHKGYKVPEVKLDSKGLVAAMESPNLATRWLAIAFMNADDLEKNDISHALSDGLHSKNEFGQARWEWVYHGGALRYRSKRANLGDVLTRGPRSEASESLFGAQEIRMGWDGPRRVEDPKNPFNPAHNPPHNSAWYREFLLAMPREAISPVLTKGCFFALAKLYDGQDHFHRAALNIACGTDPKRRDEILADFDKHFPEWNDKVADLAWELRPKSVLPRLTKLLTDAKLTDKQKARVLEVIVAFDDASAGSTMLGVLKTDAPAEVKARAVDQLRLFLPTKWKTLQGSKELGAAIDDLLKSSPATGLQLVAAANAVDRVDAVAELVGGKEHPADVRREALRTLGKLKSKKSAEQLAAAILFANEPALQAEAVRALGTQVSGQPKDEVGAMALKSLQTLLAPTGVAKELQSVAVEALAGSRAGTDWLLQLKESGKFPKDVDSDAGRFLRNSPFEVQRAKAQRLFPAPGKLNPKNLPALAVLAKRDGDAARGKLVWDASFAGAAQCAKCHTVRGVGGQVGPDLSMIGKKGGKENLLESILFPSKAIADQYVQAIVLTTADVTVTGLVVADTPQALTLRDANGKDVVIPKADIASQKKATTSIMPEDIVAGLTEDELIDIVAYLTTLQTAALTPAEFKIAGPYPGTSMLDALNKDHGPEAGTREENWKTIRADAKGYFDLAAFHGDKGKNSASYMMAMFDSPSEQDAEVLLGPDDGSKLFVNGKEVFKSEETVAATPGKHKVPIKLKKGPNAILLKVANGDNPHGFYFTLLSKDEVKIAK